MQMKASVAWKDGMAFEAHLDGFNFFIDSDEQYGGRNLGPRPKGLTLISLAGCTAMDVIAVLQKMQVKVDSFEVATNGVTGDEYPREIQEVLIKYIFKGKDLSLGKIKKAVDLSLDKYCGVYATLKPGVKMSYQIIINGEVVDSD